MYSIHFCLIEIQTIGVIDNIHIHVYVHIIHKVRERMSFSWRQDHDMRNVGLSRNR
jgi:hypothetical protein